MIVMFKNRLSNHDNRMKFFNLLMDEFYLILKIMW